MEELTVETDRYFMQQAYKEAETAYRENEVPVGVVITCKGRIIARAHNLTERLNDVTAHAEMQAITAATAHIGGRYLDQCTLYVTLEPCVMCAGALFWCQLGRLVFGAYDKQRGYTLLSNPVLHQRTTVVGGMLGDQCAQLLQSFFAKKRL